MTAGGPDPLKDALDLQVRVRALQALLELQRWQIEVLNNRLYSSEPGGDRGAAPAGSQATRDEEGRVQGAEGRQRSLIGMNDP